MGAGAFIEPLVVVTLLLGGTYLNRNRNYTLHWHAETPSIQHHETGALSPISPSSTSSLLDLPTADSPWRQRRLHLFKWHTVVTTPNTRQFRDRYLSRVLRKYPFLVEAWYWALIYWVYQLGRAFSALTLVEGTVNTARRHALQVIHVEQTLGIFKEVEIQKWFLARPTLLKWTNRTYSFIHIPGTIAFLVSLYWYTTTKSETNQTLPVHYSPVRSPSPRSPRERKDSNASRDSTSKRPWSPQVRHFPLRDFDINTYADGRYAGPKLYEARRRTMATCNLLAFVIFTLWPCMPPRLLSDANVPGEIGKEARGYGFVDTVHSENGESSVWTQNKFCNQYGKSQVSAL
jgi:hypothetical protein